MRSMMTAADIAKALFISVNTVKTHQRSIYRKLGAASRRDVLKIAAARGIILRLGGGQADLPHLRASSSRGEALSTSGPNNEHIRLSDPTD